MKWKSENRNTPTDQVKPKPGFFREWGNALVFAVVFATLIRWSAFEAYAIPSSSMEQSLLTGDYLFVSKLHYGPRTPLTPLQIPLTHQTIWGTNIPSFSDALQFPYFRLPGFSEIKHNDAVVFNHPDEEERPIDLKTFLIKRCIGLPGETLSIINQQVFLNNEQTKNPKGLQYSFFIKANRVLNKQFFQKNNITDFQPAANGYLVHTLPAKARELRALDFITEVTPIEMPARQAEPGIFLKHDNTLAWNKDNFGPVYIPKEGTSITLTNQTWPIYKKVITKYEGNPDAEFKNNQLYLNGQIVPDYTFKQNYYFMMGDNRHNSNDSRYWGFVPEEYVVGKATLVWLSVDSAASFPENIRWKRIFKMVN